MEERRFIDKQKRVADEKGSSHQILCKGTGFWSLKTPASLVPSSELSDQKVHAGTTRIAIAGELTTPELPLKACLLVVAAPPPPESPDTDSRVGAPATLLLPPKPLDYKLCKAGALKSEQ